MKFIISRDKWRYGWNSKQSIEKFGYTELLNHKGYKCCLGFVAQQLGIDDNSLLGISSPERLFSKDIDKVKPILIKRTKEVKITELSVLTLEAIAINDNGKMSNEEREIRLENLFERHGHELIFEGEYGN